MKIITCAVCGVPLRPEEARKCSECGHIVCREHIRFHHGRWICTTCLKKKLHKEVMPRERELALELAVIQF